MSHFYIRIIHCFFISERKRPSSDLSLASTWTASVDSDDDEDQVTIKGILDYLDFICSKRYLYAYIITKLQIKENNRSEHQNCLLSTSLTRSSNASRILKRRSWS